VLLAYLDHVREVARKRYETELLMWAAIAPHSTKRVPQPTQPKVLEER